MLEPSAVAYRQGAPLSIAVYKLVSRTEFPLEYLNLTGRQPGEPDSI